MEILLSKVNSMDELPIDSSGNEVAPFEEQLLLVPEGLLPNFSPPFADGDETNGDITKGYALL